MIRQLNLPCVLLFVITLLESSVVTVHAADAPNVLFLPVDDLNDWIGCLGGHPQCKTPNMDRLAERGVLFTRSYCAAPACNPSRASLMTGVRPWTSGVYHNPQPWRPAMPAAVTLPQLFMQHGYHATKAGKIFHGRYEEDASWDYIEPKTRDPKPTKQVANDPHSRAGGIIWGKLDVSDEEMNDYKMADYAINYLKEPHDKPFFLACGIYRPHMPWQVPQKYYDMYPVESVVLPTVPADDLNDIPSAGVKVAKPQGDHKKVTSSDNHAYAVQAYLASITFADAQIGRILDALDASNYKDNTIICLWGDHGWHLGEKQHWRKFALWEEATRAPLIIVAPGVTKPGGVCERTVDFMNVYPTLADLCGLPIGDHLEGVTMRPLLENPNAEWDRPAITTHGRGNHAVRTEQYRYIRYSDGSEELYDHDSDPNEWTNLADKPEVAALKKELAAHLPIEESDEAAYDPHLVQAIKTGWWRIVLASTVALGALALCSIVLFRLWNNSKRLAIRPDLMVPISE